jgi:hypothetical protein
MNQVMWAALKKYIITKNSHGKNELLQAMTEIEISTLLPGPTTPKSNCVEDSYHGPG